LQWRKLCCHAIQTLSENLPWCTIEGHWILCIVFLKIIRSF
jgi:hypothetical protein